MTATYVLSTLIGQVRLTIGDKDVDPAADAVFSDEEIQVFLDANLDNVRMASAQALEAWAATYGANAESEKMGNYDYTQKIVDNMLKLAEKLRTAVEEKPAMEIGLMDLSLTPLVEDD